MVGVCMTVISIIKLTGNGNQTWVDELLALDSLIFVVSIILSYISVRRGSKMARCEELADTFFMVGMAIMAISAFILAFEIF